MLFEIKNRWAGSILFSIETDTIKLAVEAAIKSKANLSWANLSWANLSKAYLSGADLSGADLSKADLRVIKHDFWGVLLQAQKEVPYLRQAILGGNVDGHVYKGECACLCGTIAHAQGKTDVSTLKYADASSPIERFFLAIRKGDTPDTNPCAKIVVEWIDEFIKLQNK